MSRVGCQVLGVGCWVLGVGDRIEVNQILLGVSVPFVAGVVIYVLRRFRASIRMLVIVPFCMSVSALWAVAPDIPRILGYHALCAGLARDPRCDIFYWHYTIDLKEADSRWYSVGLMMILLLLIMAAWRELRIAETESSADAQVQSGTLQRAE